MAKPNPATPARAWLPAEECLVASLARQAERLAQEYNGREEKALNENPARADDRALKDIDRAMRAVEDFAMISRAHSLEGCLFQLALISLKLDFLTPMEDEADRAEAARAMGGTLWSIRLAIEAATGVTLGDKLSGFYMSRFNVSPGAAIDAAMMGYR